MKFSELAAAKGLERKAMYTITQVSDVLGVPYRTLRLEIDAGRLRAFLPRGMKHGRMVAAEWVDSWIEEGTV